MAKRHALANFAVKVEEDAAFSTVKSVLLPETASHEAQFVLAWKLTHAFSHFYSWNIKTRSHHSKHRKAHLLRQKNNTFIRKGVVLWQCILPVTEESKKVAHKQTNSSADDLIFVWQFRFLRRALHYL